MALNGSHPSGLNHHLLYGINKDMTVGYLSAMVWCLSWDSGESDHFRVDYGNYIAGEEDYICHEPHLSKVDFTIWDRIAYSIPSHKEFFKLCDTFIEGQSFDDYRSFIYRYLIESSWNYSAERALEKMNEDPGYIDECYKKKVPVSECAVEIGYCCG